jgi:MYXO-CTERM domain-containing protein
MPGTGGGTGGGSGHGGGTNPDPVDPGGNLDGGSCSVSGAPGARSSGASALGLLACGGLLLTRRRRRY